MGHSTSASSIGGAVTDAAGNPLPLLQVLALHEPTGSVFARITDVSGFYRFAQIKAGGPYAITVNREGQPVAQVSGFKLKTGEMRQLDFVVEAHPHIETA